MQKRTETTFFFRISILLAGIRSGFVNRLLSIPKKHSIGDSQSPIKPELITCDSDHINSKRRKPFAADVKISPFKPARFSPEEAAVDDFFSNVQFEQVKDELNRWFFFGLADHGKQIADLTPEQVECFKRELPQLISALYNYHRSTRKEAGNDA